MNWEQLKTIFDRALELDGKARIQFLDEACDGDGGLRSEVEDLLESYEAADGFLTDGGASPESSDTIEPKRATFSNFPVVDRYQICEQIGEGGFGTVYLADQLEPLQRQVALKVIRSGVSSRSIVKRFEAERQTLARMDHPNIAGVFDAGETATGSPYLVMEYIEGSSIVEYCDERCLTIRERLALFLDVCAGVQHAHQKGIIHRDIKPSNVLVPTRAEDVIPKVIDFGVAKALEPDRSNSTLTTQQQIVGTPVYMSPEQAVAAAEKIDTRSDIYSLGVLLYELLTGTTPFDSKTLLSAGVGEMIRVIQEVDPERPSTRVAIAATEEHEQNQTSADSASTDTSAQRRQTDTATLCRKLRGDLDWIVMKCLEKDPNRRYATAAGLADDLRRHLGDQPIMARPPSVSYRFQKLARRNTAAVMISIALVIALVAGAAASTIGFLKAERARNDAQEAERSARTVTRYLASILGESSPERLGPEATVGQILDRRDDELGSEFEDQPLVEAELRRTIGDAYSGMGWFDKGAEHLSRAVELYEGELGTSDRHTLHAKVRLAANRRGAGQYEIAEGILRDVLVVYAETNSVPLRQKLVAEYELAVLLRIQNKYAESTVWSERVYQETVSNFGANDEQTLSAQQNLASLYDAIDRRAEAWELMNRALAVQNKTLGPTHPDTLLSRFNIAIRHCMDGKHHLAVEIYAPLIEDYEARLGLGHRMTNAVRSYFAYELAHVGQLAEADALMMTTLTDQQDALPATHRDVLDSLRHAVVIKESMGAFAAAIPLAQQRLEALRQVHGAANVQVLTEMINLGATYRSTGELEKSEDLFRRGIRGFREVLGPTHPETTNSTAHLISLLHKQKRYQEEEVLIRESLSAFKETPARDHAGYQELIHRRGHLLQATGLHTEAIQDFRSSFRAQIDAIRDRAQILHYGDCLTNELLGQGQYAEAQGVIEEVISRCFKEAETATLQLAGFLDRQAHCCVQLKDFESGRQSAARSLGLRQSLQPENDMALAGTKMLLAICILGLEEYDEAAALLREVLAVREKNMGVDNWLLHNTRSVLGECLLLGGDYEAAKPLILEAHTALTSMPSTPKQRLLDSENRKALLLDTISKRRP